MNWPGTTENVSYLGSWFRLREILAVAWVAAWRLLVRRQLLVHEPDTVALLRELLLMMQNP
jgi:hypothetical protein